jgi:hypothetical protein
MMHDNSSLRYWGTFGNESIEPFIIHMSVCLLQLKVVFLMSFLLSIGIACHETESIYRNNSYILCSASVSYERYDIIHA